MATSLQPIECGTAESPVSGIGSLSCAMPGRQTAAAPGDGLALVSANDAAKCLAIATSSCPAGSFLGFIVPPPSGGTPFWSSSASNLGGVRTCLPRDNCLCAPSRRVIERIVFASHIAVNNTPTNQLKESPPPAIPSDSVLARILCFLESMLPFTTQRLRPRLKGATRQYANAI
jgi:hypothetical protein